MCISKKVIALARHFQAGAQSSLRSDAKKATSQLQLGPTSCHKIIPLSTYFPTFLHVTNVDSKIGSSKLNDIIVLVFASKDQRELLFLNLSNELAT